MEVCCGGWRKPITLSLCNEQVLLEPLLYLSLYFKTHRPDYYDHLQRVRIEGDWEGWLRFFLQGVFETSQQAVETARSLMQLFEQDRERIRSLGRISGSCLQLHQRLQEKVIVNIPASAQVLGINRQTISNCIRRLQELGIVREITGQKRNRLFVYERYIQILSEGTEPL